MSSGRSIPGAPAVLRGTGRDWGVTGPHQFGYNKKDHLRHFIFYLPLSAALAGICTLF